MCKDRLFTSSSAAFRIIGEVGDAGPWVLTCEHGGNVVPAPLAMPPEEQHWLTTHWGYDIGAAAVVEQLTAATCSVAIQAVFTRLVCDLNRPWGHPECIRESIEGHRLRLNSGLTADELRHRQGLHRSYHAAADELIRRRSAHAEPFLLLAVHSFTPVYEGQRRAMELGVLFDDRCELQAQELGRLLSAQGFCVALNEPYSGHDGLIYSVARHGTTFSLPYLEIEIRQDLLASAPQIAKVTASLDAALSQLRNSP